MTQFSQRHEALFSFFFIVWGLWFTWQHLFLKLFWCSIYVCVCVKAAYDTALYKAMSSEGHSQAALKTTRMQLPYTGSNHSNNNCMTRTRRFSLKLCRSRFGFGYKKTEWLSDTGRAWLQLSWTLSDVLNSFPTSVSPSHCVAQLCQSWRVELPELT